jgi:chemotaxis protein histidine kinase CheA
VVKDYRGRIEFHTEEGVGTTFKVSVPCTHTEGEINA